MAVVIDVYARYIVGWRVSRTAHAGFVLDALEQAIHDRRPISKGGLIHQSDRPLRGLKAIRYRALGSQYLSIKYTERLAEAGIEPSVGSVGDNYDNALAETINGLYKAEVIHRRGPWRSFEAVEFATSEWIDWFNHRRLLEPISNIPPAEASKTATPQWTKSPSQHNLNKSASGNPGAVHSASNDSASELKNRLSNMGTIMPINPDFDFRTPLACTLTEYPLLPATF